MSSHACAARVCVLAHEVGRAAHAAAEGAATGAGRVVAALASTYFKEPDLGPSLSCLPSATRLNSSQHVLAVLCASGYILGRFDHFQERGPELALDLAPFLAMACIVELRQSFSAPTKARLNRRGVCYEHLSAGPPIRFVR